MTPKPWYRSIVVWINLVTVVAGSLADIAGDTWVQHNPKAVAFCVSALALVNLFLRILKTSAPILGGFGDNQK